MFIFTENRPGLNADDESDASSTSSGVESSDEEIGESNDDIESGIGAVAPNGLPLYKTAPVEIMPMRPRLTSRLSSMSSASLRPQRTISVRKFVSVLAISVAFLVSTHVF